MRREREAHWRWIFLVALVGFLSGSCSRWSQEKPRQQAEKLNTVLVVIDALRADHVGSYGYPLDTTPAIDRLARNALLATATYTQSNWTEASMASIMTGTYPAVHKILRTPDDGLDRFSVLPTQLQTIAQVLKWSGYFTGAVSSCGWVSPTSGFGRGFAEFRIVERSDEAVVRNAIEVLGPRHEPFFLYLHLLDTHDYYDLQAAYRPFAGRRFELSATMKRLVARPRAEVFGWLGTPENAKSLSADDVAYLEDRYDSLLNRTDQLVGRLIEFLRERKVLDRTLVVLTADHGESFSEHGRFVHNGDSVYNETLHVPLIVHNRRLFPQQRRVTRLSESVDIFPTVVDLLGIKDRALSEARQLQGHSLVANVESKVVWSQSATRERMKILVDNWSLIQDARTGRAELYDLRSDPRETRDLARERSGVVGRMKVLLEQKIKESQAVGQRILPQDAPIDPETKAMLRSLGYLK